MAAEGGISRSKVSPAFLHANSTSHTWPFSAIAELIDNAYDPDVNASELWIDKVVLNGKDCLTFADNGNGLDGDKLLKMLSFGFCEKEVFEKSPHKPIGHYGNGFKSGSMRLAQDAVVFTRHVRTMSVGMLSQTYLKRINSETVLVPIVSWTISTKEIVRTPEARNNLLAILRFSIFNTEAQLMHELNGLERLRTGTKIVLYNLKRTKDGQMELDFLSSPNDIRNPETQCIDLTSVYRPIREYSPEYRRSLREYCSILFLKPRMKIVLRGQKVKTKLISKSLSHTEIDVYRPTWLARPIKIVFGFACNKKANSDDYGLMLYHRNRLIKAYEKVGYQKQPNDLGLGVVGVVQVDFLQPIHNKQEFNKDDRYNAFMQNIATKLNDYWNEKKCGGKSQGTPSNNLPDWLWAQCENCLKWRRLPDGIEKLPDRWFCHMNPDASHNRCDIEEEPEDEDQALQRSYKKTFKKEMEKEKLNSKWAERQQVLQKEEELRAREAALRQKMQQIESVSSTNFNSRKSIANLEKALIESKQREALQKRLILQLQEQKKNSEVKKKELLNAAENLRLMNSETSMLIEDASNLAGESSVSSTSVTKRKAEGEDSSAKKMRIKTEDGDLVAVIHCPETGKEIIDLTSDPEEEAAASPTAGDEDGSSVKESVGNDASDKDKSGENQNSGDSDNVTEKTDVKPDKAELDKQMNEKDSSADDDNDNMDNMQGETEMDGTKNDQATSNDSMDTTVDVKPNIGELNRQMRQKNRRSEAYEISARIFSKFVQTTPVDLRPACSDGIKQSSLKPIEQRQQLITKCGELADCKEKLKSLQDDIYKLLRIIVPDVELGDSTDIQYIIGEMIRVNSEVPNEVNSEVNSDLNNEVNSDLNNEMNSDMSSDVNSEVSNKVNIETNTEANSAVNSAVNSPVNSAMNSPVNSAVNSPVNSPVNSAVNSAVNSEVPSTNTTAES
ncbi:MORC family CW-type zinc finger protein 3-like isoform X2 [Gigantopelta aegis]|uniref:MORC family CW-type zinc finger protein 3-like isoform X2 n=1 Tax=Gigantopelta aegis TaxID=1735272 RepID=UPI001B88C70F|nr:MORC family CW-type zinc finger protein 3-like isoform X2 [Gigantopelta aegis]